MATLGDGRSLARRSLLLLLLGGVCGGVDGRLGDAALVLECHVVGGRQRHAGAEDVLDAAALQGEEGRRGWSGDEVR